MVAAHIRYILNVTWVVDCKFSDFITYKKVEIEDEDGEDIGQYLDDITDFILEVGFFFFFFLIIIILSYFSFIFQI